KIRQRVTDPVVAELLVPKDHPFGSKRIPCETGYYDVFNRDNVLLVDVRDTPIKRITPQGIQTDSVEYELDVIIFATGYDAGTGSLTRIDIRGEGGRTIKNKYVEGPRNYMGLLSAGFPNLFIMPGAGAGNFTRGCEPVVEWVSDCIKYIRQNKFKYISASPEAEDTWTKYVAEAGANSLRTKADSWFVGANIPGKARVLLGSPDSAPIAKAKRDQVAANGYEGFLFR
ncbi:cyclohexanone monooxygenase, partial [Dehalococcoidia bacterium]|nr:cyclohexanone monooxygenase [Dehalococcoidia bacterium]